MIHIKNIKFSYPSSHQGPTVVNKSAALIDIPQLEIQSGEKIFLFGPSGSGKTTFLELLGGIQSVQSGELTVGGISLEKLSSSELDRWRSENVGIIFQSFNLIPSLNVIENVMAPNFWRSPEKQISKSTALDFLARLGMSDFLHRPIFQLSLGQQQRVAAARTLCQHPKLILADEPTSSLDQDMREEFLKTLFSLSSQISATIVFVSHDRTMGPLFDRQLNWLEVNSSAKGVTS